MDMPPIPPMAPKDPWSYPVITYVWVMIIAGWGGFVSFIQKRKSGIARPFNFMELVGEIVTSAFVGVITFWLCDYSNIPPLLSAAFIAITGHMGSRAIFQLERWMERKVLGQSSEHRQEQS